MSTNWADVKLRRGAEVARLLGQDQQVRGVCLFGSVARGDATMASDIDIVVLVRSASSIESLTNQISRADDAGDVSARVFTEDELSVHLARSPLFAVHLRTEGILYHDVDSRLRSLFDREYSIAIDDELAFQAKNLNLYRDIRRFGEALLLPLARVYSIGRAAVFLRLWELGMPEFSADKAFKVLGYLQPRWRPAMESISELRPFYQMVRSDSDDLVSPFEPAGEVAKLRLLEAIDHLDDILTARATKSAT